MINMRQVNLRSIDLNLLTVLQILIEEQHVTKAADRLNMSQSAVSRALQRLRVLFNDPLLVKGAAGYSLSSRALNLSTELAVTLQSISNLIQEPEFDPYTARSVIRFAGTDLAGWIDMPVFMQTILAQAPSVKIEVSTIPADYFAQLAKGQVDFLVSGIEPTKNLQHLHSYKLGSSELMILMGKQNPLATQTINLQQYLEATHGYVSITGKGPAFLDSYLANIGLKRNVVLKISDIRSVVDYCEKTNILFMLPIELISDIVKEREVVQKPLPKELLRPSANFYLYWHARFHQDPLHRWLREIIVSKSLRGAV